LLLNGNLEFLVVENLLVDFTGAGGTNAVGPKEASDLLESVDFTIFSSIDIFIKELENFIKI
jgi:hypothetical protein